MKTLYCDIAVIGAGPAGLAAAVQAASAGLSIMVFEKTKKAGGLREGGIGPFAAESDIQERAFVDLSKEQAFEYMMDFTHWTTDARLVSAFINQSGETISWLENLGVQFDSVSAYYKGGKQTQHNIKGEKITTVLKNRADELGVSFFFQTVVRKILTKEGSVTGLVAAQNSGEELHVQSKAVLVATGGFAGNDQMVRDVGYTRDVDIMYTFDMGINCGEGAKMIWEVGGAHSPMMMDTYVGLTSGYGGPLGTAPALAVLRQQTNLMVNQKGLRFMPEDLCRNPGYTGNAVHRQYKGCAISMLDETMYQEYFEKERLHPSGPPLRDPEDPSPPEPFERFNGIPADKIMIEARNKGCKDFFVAESLESFAEQAELPYQILLDTIREYNQFCENKEDVVFHKNPKYLHSIDLSSTRYYGARFFCDTYGGLGGVKINEKAQVLDTNDDPIPGLYCAGNDANTIYGGAYPFYLCGNTSSFAINTGRLAAKDIIQSIPASDTLREG